MVSGFLADIFNVKFFVDPETVGQWTGLVDKNGTKIFEGDILEGNIFENEMAVVSWKDESAMFLATMLLTSFCPIISLQNIGDEYRIIGNIHDNPELLRAG
jgi:hypothetical protein